MKLKIQFNKSIIQKFKKMKNSKDALKVIGGILIGAAAGAALAILYSPDKGTITRSKIKGNAKGMLKEVKKQVKDETKKMKKKFQEASDHLLEGKFELQKDGSLCRSRILR